ncbi:D-lactate dehydrogenase [Roseobacter fucihabitans]|uniref:D-lactate dehydrogenase n=1 Tax=Roseobacter fucihabitans TaxID=1537242 RepID=UPI001652DDC1|nr:D-lactate dehydrogenase [Roseobacter litoralis]
MTDHDILNSLRQIVGKRHVLTGQKKTERFRKGWRSGQGDALCVVQPGDLVEQWRVLQTCVAADKIIIMQAANTGLTEGSTPSGSYERDVVLINTRRMDGLHLLKGGAQVLALPGSTLFALEKLLDPLGRQPHSVIGSSCIGASVVGGVCNNSGGSLIERGPSYTELSLFAQIDATGALRLVNHLGLSLGDDPEDILRRVQAGRFSDADFEDSNKKASDTDYTRIVRAVEADTPARFNSDTRCLHETAGCAGKLAVFAVRLDTYPKNDREQVFYVGTNDPADLTMLRRHMLAEFETLPVSAEYMHRDVFDITTKYGKDTMVMIDKLGTARLPMFFAIKGAVDARLNKIPLLRGFTDKFMQVLSGAWPKILPDKMMAFRDRFEHHLIIKTRDGGIAETDAFLHSAFADSEADFFACTQREGKLAGLHRFAAAGAAIRYQNVHAQDVEDILALDIALRRNDRDWFEKLPAKIGDQIVHRLYYGHFMCHVLHQDYILRKGADVKAIKAQMLDLLEKRGAEYPAEHNVGHLYKAKPDLAAFYKSVDPTNSMNPGIGKMSKKKNYA